MFIMHRTYRRRAGLTLIEMLVVLALTLFIMTLFTTLFVQATGGMNNARGLSRLDQSLRTTLTLLRKDLHDVYIDGNGVTSPANVFAPGTTLAIPSAGYFSIEENSPAVRQGLDQWGIPVEVDVDDVLRFTAARDGTGPQELFYATVPLSNPPLDYERTLDNFGAPLSRFDRVDDGVTTSRYAEVVYFLRPNGNQPSADQVRGHQKGDDADTDSATVITPGLSQPQTYTLYRKQILVLPEEVATQLDNTVSIDQYSRFAGFSVKPDPDNLGMLKFNHPGMLDLRKNRFGYHHHQGEDAMSPIADTGNDYPLSWTNPSNSTNSSASRSIFSLNSAAAGGRAQWFGAPTSLETNFPLVNFFASIHNAILSNDADDDENGVLGGTAGSDFDALNSAWAANAALPYDHGDDILLENVISFDVKVYDNDPRNEENAVIFNASRPTVGVNPSRFTNANNPGTRSYEFVDLGYRGDEGGVWTQINNEYVTSTNGFDFASNPPYGFPGRWRLPGIAPTGVANSATYMPVRTYDTWSDEYVINPADVDVNNLLKPVPYAKPLPALQIKLRVWDPKSGVVRETEFIHRFAD